MHERRRVLLLDSDVRRRHVTATLLRLGGYSVLEGARQAEFPGLLAEGVDLLLSEAKLEDGDAVDFAAGLRQAPATIALPILIATTDRSAELRTIEALGELSFLMLPDRPSRLLNRIAQLLARRVDVAERT